MALLHPEAAKELQRIKRLILVEQREAEADRRADERAKRAAQRRGKQQPVHASSAAEAPQAAAAGEARPAQPGSDRPSRRRNNVALPETDQPPPAREGLAGFLDRKDADRATRFGRAPGQSRNSSLEPREFLEHQVQLAKVDGDRERIEEAERILREWDAQ
jgi:hypothetical protein